MTSSIPKWAGSGGESHSQPPKPSHYLTYALPVVSITLIYAPLSVIQGIYAKYYGLSLTTIAAILLFGRFFDAITDPLIGYYSDRYRARFGSRKPFVLGGSLLMVVSGYFLYVPIETSVIYLSFWLFAFYLAFTLFDIPHNAWASELALTSSDKSSIYSYRTIAVFLGQSFFYVIPMLPFFETQEITPKTLQVSMISAAVLTVLFSLICIKFTPDGVAVSVTRASINLPNRCARQKLQSLRVFIRTMFSNRPFVVFMGSYIFYGLGINMWYGFIFLYVSSYLKLGEYFAPVFLASYGVGVVITPLWCRFANAFGKKLALGTAIALIILSFIYTSMLKPGETDLGELVALVMTNTVGVVCFIAIAPAMFSKIVDYSTWKNRQENTAIYFSIYFFLTKIDTAVGASMGLAIASWYGFDAMAEVQSLESVTGLLLVMSILPVSFLMVSLYLIYLNPINAQRHSVVRRRLDRKVSAEIC